MARQAVLFDLGNTLVDYYTADEFPAVLARCLDQCTRTLGRTNDVASGSLLSRALDLNRERPDLAVYPLGERLTQLFGDKAFLNDAMIRTLGEAFLQPIFDLARVNSEAIPVLTSLRARGILTAIVSNTPWGSDAALWRQELARHGLLERVDATVFCGDVGWRKPHPAPFSRALELIGVNASEAVFVGDDPRWDVAGARAAGIRPVLFGGTSISAEQAFLSVSSLRDVLELVSS